jgi:hypothetical protein
MPLTTRTILQHRRVRATQASSVIPLYVGEKFYQHIKVELGKREDLGIETPSLEWCNQAANFAIFGDYEALHKVFPDWLKTQFINRKILIIEALHWCQDYWNKLLFTKSGDPKTKGHMFVAALCYGDEVNLKYNAEIGKAHKEGRTLSDEQIEALIKIDTRELHKFAQEKGFIPKTKNGAGDERSNFDNSEKMVNEAIKTYEAWYSSLKFEEV